MQYLSVCNLGKYQHYKQRNPPWVKMYREVWTDYTLRACSVSERLLFLGLTTLGMELKNEIPNDPKYLTARLGFAITTHMISHLLSFNLLSSNLDYHVASTEHASTALASRKHVASKPTEAEWVASLTDNPAYQHINLAIELGKMDAWLSLPAHQHRKRTKRFIVSWLNRIDVPLKGNGGGKTLPPPFPPKTDPIARGQWRAAYGDPRQYGYD